MPDLPRPRSSGSSFFHAANPPGNQATPTNALGKTWTTTFDLLGRAKTSTDPLGNATTNTYDANGNVTHVAKPTGVTTRYIYDRVNRQTGIDLTNDSSTDITFAYDAASRRTSMVDATGTTTYSYDAATRLTSLAAPTGTYATGTAGYTYDAAGRLTGIDYPNTGHDVTYAYDNAGALSTVTDWQAKVSTYTYDAAGRRSTATLPNGQAASEFTYDAASHLTNVKNTSQVPNGRGTTTTVTHIPSTYDDAGRQATHDGATFTYDNADRLTNIAYTGGGSTAYTYDAASHRASMTQGGTTTTYTYDNAGRMTAAGSDTYGYDGLGNTTSKTSGGTTTTYTYDALSRMTGISGGASASYVYNGDGWRVAKTVSGTTTTFAFGQTPMGLQVLSDGATESVWGLELLTETAISTSTLSVRQTDGRGRVRTSTDTTGLQTSSAAYDVFGNLLSSSGTQSRFANGGAQTDSESRLGDSWQPRPRCLHPLMPVVTAHGAHSLPADIPRTHRPQYPNSESCPPGSVFITSRLVERQDHCAVCPCQLPQRAGLARRYGPDSDGRSYDRRVCNRCQTCFPASGEHERARIASQRQLDRLGITVITHRDGRYLPGASDQFVIGWQREQGNDEAAEGEQCYDTSKHHQWYRVVWWERCWTYASVAGHMPIIA